MASDGPKKKAHKERLSTCSYCPMTFKKLEHAQRHERTHTLDRPYSCDTCGKTFARQDTLHRHTRLHSRTEDEGPAGKGPKKRRASTSSAKPSTSNAPKSPKPSSSSSSGSSSSKPLPIKSSNKVIPNNSKQDEAFTSSSAAFGLSMSLPVHPPSFPAYSQPETFLSHNSTTSSHNADFPSIGNSNSIDPSVLPLYSRLGDVGTNSNYGNRIPTRRASHAGGTTQVRVPSAIGGGGGAGNGGSTTLANGGMSRPRALTLAGLPESFGCFSLINSPASSTASLSPDEEDDDDDDEYRDSSMEQDPIAEEKQDPTWTVDSPSFPPAPESHYPSPAFTSYSPSDLHTDSLTDLQAILDNDPVPSNSFGKSQSRRRRATHQVGGTQLASVPEPDFDFEAFAASIEGAAPPHGLAPGGAHHRSLSYDEILHSQKNGGGGNLFDRYPTPPTDTIPTLPLPTSTDNEFEWLHQYTASAEAQQQAREDAAATAAMFSRGFGLDPSQTTTSSSSSSTALGLNLGLPSPPLTAMAMHAHTAATTSSSPHFSLPISTSSAPPTQGQGVFSNLAQTYASTYPTFSLSAPHATIVPTPLQSALASHSSISIATTEPGTDSSTTSPSLHDLLAAAWERRQRQPSSSQSSTNPILPASINLKSPFASSHATSPQAKQTPAFYIPSAMHSSAAQIGTATNVDSQAMTVSASGPLSLPIPTWAN